MHPTESTGGLSPARQSGIDSDNQSDPGPVTDGGPDHDVPVSEQLTDRQRELVEDNGGPDNE